MQIALAKKVDLPKILQLQKDSFLQEAILYDDYSIPALTQTLASIEKDLAAGPLLKLTVDKMIAGSVRAHIEGSTCYIKRLVVAPTFQNQGFGKALMNAIEAYCLTVERFELYTGHQSEKNLALYKKLGYVIFKKVRNHDRLTFVFLEKMK